MRTIQPNGLPDGQDLCECCGKVADRTEQLSKAAKLYGGFLCAECLLGYLFERLETHIERPHVYGTFSSYRSGD